MPEGGCFPLIPFTQIMGVGIVKCRGEDISSESLYLLQYVSRKSKVEFGLSLQQYGIPGMVESKRDFGHA